MPTRGLNTTVRTPPGRRGRGIRVAQHVLLATMGGYILSAGLVALAARVLAAVVARSEAVVIMVMLAFLIYLTVLLWAFAEPRLTRLWSALGGGSLAVWIAVHCLGPVPGSG